MTSIRYIAELPLYKLFLLALLSLVTWNSHSDDRKS